MITPQKTPRFVNESISGEKLVAEKGSSSAKKTCSVCLTERNTSTFLGPLRCRHVYCKYCMIAQILRYKRERKCGIMNQLKCPFLICQEIFSNETRGAIVKEIMPSRHVRHISFNLPSRNCYSTEKKLIFRMFQRLHYHLRNCI